MRQHVAVRAIIRKDEKTLFLRRSNGRPTILGKYELPGGKVDYGEQPEDALTRHIGSDTGVSVGTVQLFDVLTYVDHDDRDIQYVFILYLVSVGQGGAKVSLSQNYDRYMWKKPSDVEQHSLTESAKLLLGVSQQRVISTRGDTVISSDIKAAKDSEHVIIYSDGGSRGNPGPSSAGFVVMDSGQDVIHQGGAYLGITTNSQAEYHGVRLGLEKALEIGVRTVECRLDSLLVVNQLNGIYHIKNRELWPVNERIRELVSRFDKVTFVHVKREFNQLADGMVNKILNAHEQHK